MENISEHISYAEGVISATGRRLGIDNTPPADVLAKMKITAHNLFEPLREHFGVPIKIISFYRCPELNKAVGGAKNSQHMRGEAIDIQGTNGVTNADIYKFLLKGNISYDQIIWEFGTDKEPDWVHISYSSVDGNRRSSIRANKIHGTTVYAPIGSEYFK